MAFYVIITKVSETPEKVVYSFGPSEDKMGRLEFDKNDGSGKEIEPAPTTNPSAFYIRAWAKIYRHWRQEGNFPDETCWAS